MTARTTITDMQDLRDLLLLDPNTPRPLSHALTTDQQSRLVEWIETAIRVRESQKTRSKTPQHSDMMTAYRAAVTTWKAALEHETVMHDGDIEIFVEKRPMPLLRDFMEATRRPFRFCPLCGTDLVTEPAA